MGERPGKNEVVGAGTQERLVVMEGRPNATRTCRHVTTHVDELDRLLEQLTPETFSEPVEYGRPTGREVW